jgi:hypothetical protein
LAASGYLDIPAEITGVLDATQDGNSLVAVGVVAWLYVLGSVTGPGTVGSVVGPRERAA